MTALGTEDNVTTTTMFSNPVVRWIDYRRPLFTFLHQELHAYLAQRNLGYLWNFGSLAGIVLVTTIANAIVVAMNYSEPDYATAPSFLINVSSAKSSLL